MPTLCNITGELRDLEGNLLRNTALGLQRIGVKGQDGSVVLPYDVTTESDASGQLDFDVYAGNYIGHVIASGRTERFPVAVPEIASADLASIIDAATVTITPSDIAAAAASAVEAASQADDAEVSAAAATAAAATVPIPATFFGLSSSPTLDQWSNLNDAIQYCSTNRFKLNLQGMDIRVGKRTTTDDVYTYVRDPSTVPADTSTTVRTYAILIPSGGYMCLTGTGSIRNLNQDDNQTIFHGVNCDYVEIGDEITLDGNHSEEGWGGTIHLMGVNHFHLGRCTFTQDSVCRIGASETRRSGLITFTHPRWEDCWGRHCIGGKPGGFEEIRGGTMTFTNARGGLNLETEDEDGLNDGAIPWTTEIKGSIDAVFLDDIDGDKDAANPVQASGVVCSEAALGGVKIGAIFGNNMRSSLGNSECLLIAGGQTDLPYASIKVGHIHATDTGQALRYDASESGAERIVIGSITGDNIGQIIKARLGNGATATPDGAKVIRVDTIDVGTCTEAFSIYNDNGTYPGDIISKLSIGECSIDLCVNSAGYIEDVTEVHFGDYCWGDVSTFESGRPYENYALWIKAARIYVKERLRSEDSHNQFLRIEVSDFAELVGIDQVTADAGGGVTIAGAGDIVLRDGQIRATGSGTNAVREDGSWTGNVELISFALNGISTDPDITFGGVRS